MQYSSVILTWVILNNTNKNCLGGILCLASLWWRTKDYRRTRRKFHL